MGTAQAQCCSPGNPVGGTTNIGILDKKAFRLINFYRYSFSEGYYKGSRKTDFSFVKNAQYNYAGVVLAYGLFKKITLETELGYYINKTQTYDLKEPFTIKGYGLNNAVLTAKYNLISKSNKPFEWTAGLGAKIPFTTKYQIVNNVELPRDVQPSTHAWGLVVQSFLYKGIPQKGMKLFLVNRYETNFPDEKNFKFGSSLGSSFFVTKSLGHSNFTAILQARHELRGYDIKDVTTKGCTSCSGSSGEKITSSGGNLIFIAPQINYTIAKKWNISLLADIPIYRNYNGTQLGSKYAFAFYLSRDFGGKCEVK